MGTAKGLFLHDFAAAMSVSNTDEYKKFCSSNLALLSGFIQIPINNDLRSSVETLRLPFSQVSHHCFKRPDLLNCGSVCGLRILSDGDDVYEKMAGYSMSNDVVLANMPVGPMLWTGSGTHHRVHGR